MLQVEGDVRGRDCPDHLVCVQTSTAIFSFWDVSIFWLFLKFLYRVGIMMTVKLVLVVKNPLANAEDIKDMGSIPGSGRSPGVGHGNLLQYSCLEDPMDEGPGGLHLMESQSWIQLKQLSTHTHAHRAKVTPLLKTFKGHTRKS